MSESIRPDARVALDGESRALFGRVGTVVARSEQSTARDAAWIVNLDPTDGSSGYYPRGATVVVYATALRVLIDPAPAETYGTTEGAVWPPQAGRYAS